MIWLPGSAKPRRFPDVGVASEGILWGTDTGAWHEGFPFRMRQQDVEDAERTGGLWYGRLLEGRPWQGKASGLYLDGCASRFHPASVAGLIVGTMGVLVFGIVLRRWLRERRSVRA